MHIRINASWDSEASVWVASSEDDIGLVTEAESLDTLVAKIRTLVPELVELNGVSTDSDDVPFDLLVHNDQRSIARA